MTSSLQQGIDAAKSGMMEQALVHLKDAIVEEPENANVWVWLAAIIEDEEKQTIFLKKALEIDPANRPAQRGLAFIERKNTFHPNQVRSFRITPSRSAFLRPLTGCGKRRCLCPGRSPCASTAACCRQPSTGCRTAASNCACCAPALAGHSALRLDFNRFHYHRDPDWHHTLKR